MTTMKHPLVSFSLVAMQFGLIALLLLHLPLSLHVAVLIIEALAILIGLWAIQAMHLGHFNIVPDPMPDIELVTDGPYRFIRHPMYFSIVLFFLPLVVLDSSWIGLSLYLALFITLFIKLSYEESLLVEKLPHYQIYQQQTKKLIPFIL
ncbi:isoprenylcysteine carboxylmethyltransferase family protein [Thiomicrorhabdus sp. Kp2]|uniref:methyltransferase family protein n=1 Tax=Thiomicrorhabdus sp. Kp2 TaxID=1123518 RepID=UPI000409B545|nr:isoprenylcysteine carboxylmethyltransferase family protein [Thiomicrorhabdus sp. Kp2]